MKQLLASLLLALAIFSAHAQTNTLYGTSACPSLTTSVVLTTCIGYQAGRDTTTGILGTHIGGNAGVSNVSGNGLTNVGETAGTSNVSGSWNTNVGNGSGANNIDGSDNTHVGVEAGFSNQHGTSLSSFGQASLRLLNGGSHDSAFGEQAGASLLKGSYNSYFGAASGVFQTGGAKSTIIGSFAGQTFTSGDNVILLGYGAEPSGATVSNEATIGNADITLTRLRGDVEIKGHIAGKFYTPTFNAGDFTGYNSMVWTVESGDVLTYKYEITNKKMTLGFSISGTSVSGTPSNNLKIKVPAGKTIVGKWFNPVRIVDNGVDGMGFVRADDGNQYVEVYKFGSAAWSASSHNTAVLGQIVFEIN